MDAYFYQDWRAEYSDHKANDKDVLMRFVIKENIEILNSLAQDLEYILENSLAKITFESNSFDFDPILNGYASGQAWIVSAYKILIAQSQVIYPQYRDYFVSSYKFSLRRKHRVTIIKCCTYRCTCK